jgi:hypothetical protein
MKTLKNAATCFDHYSDHLQGARRFLLIDTNVIIYIDFVKINPLLPNI